MSLQKYRESVLKVAFVGGAYDSAVGRAHRTAISMDQRFDLVAGCFSRNSDKNEDSAKQYGVDHKRLYRDLASLLKAESDSLDAIVVLTPQDQHAAQVEECIIKGVPVICEKALARTSLEALKIENFLIEKKGLLTVTYNYTGYPMIRELRHMISTGFLGRIQQIQIEMPQEGFARVTAEGAPILPQEWRLRDGEIPTLSLDLGVHLHMMVKFLIGAKPEEVVAIASSRGNFPEIIDNIQCLARYSDEVDCGIWYSKTALGYRNGLSLRIFGSKGSAEWIQANPEYINYANNVGVRYVLDRASSGIQIANQPRYQRFKAGHPAGFLEAFANYYVDIAEALHKYNDSGNIYFGDYVFGVKESIEGLEMLEAITRSSQSRKWEVVSRLAAHEVKNENK